MAGTVGTVQDFLRPAAEEIGKNIVTLVKRQISYMCCFKSNIKNLKKEYEKLELDRDVLQRKVDEVENNGEEISPKIVSWLKNVGDIQNDAKRIWDECSNMTNGCFGMTIHYSLSREAKKGIELIKEHLLEVDKLGDISTGERPAAVVPMPKVQALEFSSRKHIEEGIIRALVDEKVNLIGICGMGGLGKTTLAKKLQQTMMEKSLFDETVMVVVSQNVDLQKLQLEIAECLGLKKIKDVDTLQARAHKLRERLRGTRRTLIILDDIWTRINLEELGIPCQSDLKGCSLLLTSRDQEVLNQMGVEIFTMNILSPEEAWKLFKDKAGDCVDNSNLVSTAKEVVKECNGLPLAIKCVGIALKDKEKCLWEDALDRLRSSNRRKMPQVLEEVYEPLQLSYDYLKDQDAKLLLLLCGQFPEDFNIELEDLSLYAIGLNMLEGVENLRQARNGIVAAIHKLKNSYLLLDGDRENTIKMHDVIRDVVRFIASKEGLVDAQHKSRGHATSEGKWIFEFPETNCEFVNCLRGSNFPYLQLLNIEKHSEWWNESEPFSFEGMDYYISIGQENALDMNDFSFLEKMKCLCMLVLKEISFESLPQEIEFMKNLRTLRLYNCTLENISIVGRLLNLEILSCVSCVNIEEVPLEIGKLRRLTLLDFSYCRGLKRITPGVISNLVELEELKMLYSFDGWESTKLNENEKRNATLKELQSLRKLVCLEIQIKDISLLEEEIRLPSVKKYRISFGHEDRLNIPEKSLVLHGLTNETISITSWIHELIGNTEGLHIEGEGSKFFHLSQVQNTIKSLEVGKCGMFEALMNTSTIPIDRRGLDVFNKLEYLKLYDLPRIKELYHGSILEGSSIKFPKLKELVLHSLPNLINFGEGIENIEFPLLEKLEIRHCPKLVSNESSMRCRENEEERYKDESHIMLFNQKVRYGGLKRLDIEGCHNVSNVWCKEMPLCFFRTLKWLVVTDCGNLKSLFLPSIVENLVNLDFLVIQNCKHMAQVVAVEKKMNEICIVKCDEIMEEVSQENDKEDDGGRNSNTFPKLELLHLEGLSNLTNFVNGIGDIEFPMLERLLILDCPKLISGLCPNESNNKCGDHKHDHDDDDGSLHLLCNVKVKFGDLKKYIFIGKYHNVNNLWCEQIPFHLFTTLDELRIEECNNIRRLFSSSTVQKLVNLSCLQITRCKHMGQVIVVEKTMNEIPTIKCNDMMEYGLLKNEDEGDGKRSCIAFPKLEALVLKELLDLTCFTEGVEKIEFCVLNELIIESCPKLRRWRNDNKLHNHEYDDDESLHLFCDHKVKFIKMEKLSFVGIQNISNIWCQQIPSYIFRRLTNLLISNFNNIRGLFSSSIAENLVNLKELRIQMCNLMGQVIEIDNQIPESSILFPCLEVLNLEYLPMLVMFCDWKCALEFPSLKRFHVIKCPNMEFLSPGSLYTPKLNKMKVDSKNFQHEELNGIEDLNRLLRLHIISTKQKESTSSITVKLEEIEEES